MKILITGATGLVGLQLIEKLTLESKYEINILTRDLVKSKKKIPFPVNHYTWDPDKGEIDEKALENITTIIHLAGENIASTRWTQAQKEKILLSRTKGSNLLLKTSQKCSTPLKKFITASAIGIYGDRDSETINEESIVGSDFLAEVCQAWERELIEFDLGQCEKVILRIGLVLSRGGGALNKMLPAFKLGVAGKIGDGQQYMSWIHIDDLINMFIYSINTSMPKTIYNAVSPRPVRNFIFTKILGNILNRPTLIPAPKAGLKVALGEMANLLLTGQKVIPKNFLDMDFLYQYRSLNDALLDLLKYDIKNENNLRFYQFLPFTPEEIFPFFKNEKNLEEITPPYLNFKVKNKSTPEIQEGTIINYQLKLHGIPLNWQSRIIKFDPNNSFVDEQIKGPYKKWYHQHLFFKVQGGTLMVDDITFKLPLSPLSNIGGLSYVKSDVNKIFQYRQKVLNKIFLKPDKA